MTLAQQLTAYPVHDENLAHIQLLLQEFGCDGYRVEKAEAPEGRRRKSGEVSLRSVLLHEQDTSAR